MKLPFVTVIIPAYNEERYIRKCLTEWVNQDYPKDKYEILVYDGMSTDRTAEIIKEFERKYPGLVFYKKTLREGKFMQLTLEFKNQGEILS